MHGYINKNKWQSHIHADLTAPMFTSKIIVIYDGFDGDGLLIYVNAHTAHVFFSSAFAVNKKNQQQQIFGWLLARNDVKWSRP